MRDVSDDNYVHDQPRKRAAVGDGISAGLGSPYRESLDSPPPRRLKVRPTLDTYELRVDTGRPSVGKKRLWTPDQEQTPKASFADPSNLASVRTSQRRTQSFQPKPRKVNQPPPQGVNLPSPINRNLPSDRDDGYDIILQPETRPISQEQLVAEVKGIYAGLVMVEAKCIEVDNKQATLAQADPGAQPKLNNEQWQALIALHRTPLHEHHDFFLASQHPSASPALRRLASKYAMPARMWRHGIHSFLELLRHRLPASLDHMLAFIYLAYSMMALLYETVPAFEDTWIECLGDLGRYRMAIEDDDIRDREVWTGVARHWYSRSKASDKAPTTRRLHRHLAILARPNALQQLFYAKSLHVVVPFTSAREPVLNTENGQYRLPPLDMSFVKAHGLLFTNKHMEKFEPTVKEFLGLLDNQIGQVTRKFMEQGDHIAVANIVAMLGFDSKDSVLMQATSHFPKDEEHDLNIMDGTETAMCTSLSQSLFREASRLSNETLRIVLQRIGDLNVLPLIHVQLGFLHELCKSPSATMPPEQFITLKEFIELHENQLGYVRQTGKVSGDTHTATRRLSEIYYALQAIMDPLNSQPTSNTRQRIRYVPRVPARYYDGVKKMDFELRDVEVEQCVEFDDESKLIIIVRRTFGSGLSDEQSSQLIEALIQAYCQLLDYADLVCLEWACSCKEQRPGPIARDSRSHPPPLTVPEASAGAEAGGLLQKMPARLRNFLVRITSLLVYYPIIARGLYFCHQIKGVAGGTTPTATSSASVLTPGLQGGLDWFSGERPAVVSTGILLGTTLWFVSGDDWKDTKLLPHLTAATAVLVPYLSKDDTCWPGQLAIAAAFGVYLDFMCVQKQTALLEKTWAMTFISLFGTGMLASLAVAYCNDFEGKYAHLAVLAGSVCLPVTVLSSVIWYAFVKCPGVAERLENGDYNGSIFAFLSNFVYNMFVAIMEAILESLERRRERRRQG
jgi:hypothetical protein